MADHESTMKWKVDVTQLKSAMQDAKRSISLANAEFKTATAGIGKWANSITGVEAKLKQLNGTLPQQKQILAQLEKQYELTAENMGENSAEAQRLKIQIENQRASIAKTEANIQTYNDKLSDLKAEEEKANTATAKLTDTINKQQAELDGLKEKYAAAVLQFGKNSTEAKTLAKEIASLSTDLAKNQKEMDQASNAADDLDRSLLDVGDSAQTITGGFTVLKGALANLVADGFRKAIDGAKEFAKTMITEAATVKAETSQFEQTFGDMGDEAEKAIKRVADSSGILDTRLKTVGAQIYAFARSSGATVPEAMELMETGLMAAADSAAYYDKSLEESSETLKSFLKGNYANDAALGVSATEFTRNAKATELFGKKYNELTEIQKQQTLLKMVTDSQKLSGAMGQAAREADGWENVQGNLNESWRQFKAQVGTPFLEALIPVIKNVTSSFQEWQTKVNWSAFNKKVKETTDSIKTGFKWIIDNGATILDVLHGIAVAFVTYKTVATVTSVVTAFKTLFVAIKAGEGIMAAFNASLALNPIALAAAGIAGLTFAFVKYRESVDETIKKENDLNEAQQKAIDKVSEMAQKYQDLADTRDESVAGITAEFGYINELKDEYNGLIDANGNVKKGYEDRANFIKSELAKAMGIEVSQIDELIDSNGRLGDSIDEIIKKKQAEATLQANEEMYNEAIKNRTSALNDLSEAQAAVDEQQQKVAKTQDAYNNVMATYNDLLEYAPDQAYKYLAMNNDIVTAHETAEGALKKANKELNAAEEAWIGYNATIQNYEGLSAAIISGDTDKINSALVDLQNGFITAETGNRKSLENQVENYKTNLANLQQAIKDGTPSVTQDMVDQAQAMVDAAEKELDKLPPEASATGKKAGKDFSDGVGSKAGDAKSAGNKVGSSADSGSKSGSSGMNQTGVKAAAGFTAGVNSKAGDAKTAGKNLGSKANTGADSYKGNAETSGSNFGRGFYNGIASWVSSVWSKAKELARSAWSGLKKGQAEGSPSKLTTQSGKFFGEGYALGIQSMMKPVEKSATDLANGAVDAMTDALGIHSPSKVTKDKVGKNLVQGIIDGVKSQKKNAKKSAAELADLYVSEGKSRVSSMKKANKLTLAQEVDFWNQMLKYVKKSSKAYNAALAQLESAKKSIEKSTATLTKSYVTDVSKINKTLNENIAALKKTYNDAVNQRADELKKTFGLFDSVSIDPKKSKDKLKENLEDQVKALKEYDSTLSALEKRLGSNSAIVAELREMGVSSTNTMKSLNEMSDAELKAYAKLFDERNKIAQKRAETENAELKKQTDAQIQQLKTNAQKQIDSLTTKYKSELSKMQKSVGDSGKLVGTAISNGIKTGMNDGMKNLNAVLKKQAQDLVNTIKKQLKIKSPSKVFADQVGKWLPLGIAEGFKQSMPKAENTMQSSINSAINELKGDLSSTNFQMSDGFGANTSASNETVSEQNITFNQYNNSPKALDRLTIYRDTNNLLFSAKVGLSNV